MKGKPLIFDNFVIYPEYCDRSMEWLVKQSRQDDNFHIAALPRWDKVAEVPRNAAVVLKGGELVYSRSKCRLYCTEKVEEGSQLPRKVNLNGKRVLILICYEVLFPEDYLLQNMAVVDLVVHLVGHPMDNEVQKEDWLSLQKVLSLLYNCPVACCCGGQGKMNITGVTKTKVRKTWSLT